MRPCGSTPPVAFPDEHYMLPPERRLGRIMQLIDDGSILPCTPVARRERPRSIQWLADDHNAGARFSAVWFDLQDRARQARPREGVQHGALDARHGRPTGSPGRGAPGRSRPLPLRSRYRRGPLFQDLSARAPRPLVAFFDETDCLVGATMVSFLTQLRHGYLGRRKVPFRTASSSWASAAPATS